MGDYTWANLEIIGGSPALRQALYAALHTYDEYDFPASSDLDERAAGSLAGWFEDVRLEWANDVQKIIARVIDAADEADRPSWVEVSTDAVYEFCGDWWRWLPALGWHYVPTGNDGNPTIGVDDVASWLELPLGEATEAFARFLGTAWVRPKVTT